MTQAYLIVGGTDTKRVDTAWEKIQKLLHLTQKLPPTHPDLTELHPERSIKIAQIRELISYAHTKPYQEEYKLIFIHDADKMTREAANALLKVLEEPPGFTHLFLFTQNKTSLLPTIISRCELIELPHHSDSPSSEMLAEELKKTAELIKSPLKKRLLSVEPVTKDRNTALSWVETQVHVWRNILLHSQECTHLVPTENHTLLDDVIDQVSALQITEFLGKIEAAQAMLQQNTNVRLTIDCLLFALPRGTT